MRRMTVPVGIAVAVISATASGIALADQYRSRPLTASSHAIDNDHDDPAPRAKTRIGVDQAKKIAQKAVPGATVTKIELEDEDHVPVWKVELTAKGRERKLAIDARTGKIIKNQTQGNDDHGADHD